ncbi:hypothetical protein D9758_009384 [Tetrapyrgos nigripes]|uniref:Uncharacterized protein n=1 Tax=Tetrapyrgos nigripes TaxID=182062 RepID=A0A8H5D1S2_9AGAR|nr:hypothetical protein D9758_009384 [Tetrapyrgos nigripes]
MSVFTAFLKRIAFNYAHHQIASNGRLQLVDFIEETPIGPVYSAFDHDADQPSWFAVVCIIKYDDGSMDAGVMEGLKLLGKASHPEVVRPWSIFEETVEEVELAFLVIDHLNEYVPRPSTPIFWMSPRTESYSDGVMTPASSSDDLFGFENSKKEGKTKGFLGRMVRNWF